MTRTRIVIDLIEQKHGNSAPSAGVNWTQTRQRFFKRKYWFDQAIGAILLFFFSPVILALWIVVKLTSTGPGFYRQTRTGINQSEFEIFKLRSMKIDAEVDGQAVWCSHQDDRITKIGGLLRRLHLDELPQLLNVARGEMALVGPRPERPSICSSLAQGINGYFDRVLVKPGITGLSQINLESDQTLDDVRRKQILDINYINVTNRWLEIRILMATALRMFGIKGELVIKWMQLCRRSLLTKSASAEMRTQPQSSVSLNTAEHKESEKPSESVIAEVEERMSAHRAHKPNSSRKAGTIFPHFDQATFNTSDELTR